MIITIAGLPGSGKTTVAKLIAEELGYDRYSIGDLQGELAQKQGLTITERMKLAENNSSIHREVDEKLEEMGKMQDNFVVDTWIGFHFIPESVKVYITVDLDVAGERTFKDQINRPDEKKYESAEDATEAIQERIQVTDEGFQRLYGVSFLDESHYDFKIDSTDMTPSEVAEKIIDFVSSMRT